MRIKDLTVRFGAVPVLDSLSLELPDHGITVIMGESGCGKTTLLRVLAGLLQPQGGSVEGLEQRKISFVFQEPRLLGWRSALENVALVSDRKTAERLLERLGLAEMRHRRAEQLSGGQQQRVSIARAFAHSDDVVLLDEPFAGLDEDNRLRVAELIRTAGLAIVVTHNEEDAALLGTTHRIRLSGAAEER